MQKQIKHSKEKREKNNQKQNVRGKKTDELITNLLFRFFEKQNKKTQNSLITLKKGDGRAQTHRIRIKQGK